MELFFIVALLIYFLPSTSSSIEFRSSGFPHSTSGFTDADLITYFTGSFPVKGQIECCLDCLRTRDAVTFYFALYHLADHLCVCQNVLDMTAVSGTSGSTDIKVIEIRGKPCSRLF